MIEIIGPALSQWDVGRSVKIANIEADCFHLANKGDLKAVIMEIAEAQAKIPDYLLQTGKQLCVYAVKDGITVESNIFFVRKRERPENYVYEDDQRNYIYELITEAQQAIEAAREAAENANPSAEEAKEAANNANKATSGANEAADTAILAAKSATEAAAKAAHTAKSLMVVGGAEGANIALDDAIDQYLVGLRIFGKSTQAGTPTPDAPVDIESVGAGGSITVNVTGEHKADSMTVATPNGLLGIPVSSGGNYTDANGQQWVCDEIDFARGVYVRRCKEIVIDGSGSFVVSQHPNSQRYGAQPVSDILALTPPNIPKMVMSDRYEAFVWTDQNNRVYCIGTNIIITDNRFTDKAAAVAILQAERPKVVYVLAIPIETPLSAEELTAYASLHTYRGSTTVSNDAGAWMDLEYVMDAKKYIDSMISTAILEATVE